MPNWINFSTVEKWSAENAGASDCSRMCATCNKEWHSLKLDGKGDMAVHMIQLPQGSYTPCQMPYKFVCNDCYLTETLL